MEILLVRYSEIGLKGRPVRRRFEAQLKENIMSMLAYNGVEAIVTNGEARLYVEAEDLDKAADSISRVFGVSSVSRTSIIGASMEEICEAAAEYSKDVLKAGQSFVVRARREGTHPYTSMDVGREAGSAIFTAHDEKVKVDLHNPDVTFFIEIRNNKSYIFSKYIPGPGGLPLGSQGKVIAHVNNDRGILSAWMMMKRGCRVYVTGTADMTLLKRYDPNLRGVSAKDDLSGILGKVLGISVDELDNPNTLDTVPVYYPTVGMTDTQVEDMLSKL